MFVNKGLRVVLGLRFALTANRSPSILPPRAYGVMTTRVRCQGRPMASSAASSPLIPYSQVEQLREARGIVRQEAEALLKLSQQIDTEFCRAVDRILTCSGCVRRDWWAARSRPR